MSEDLEQQARELLAAEIGCPIESDTALDLRDYDDIPIEWAIRAVKAALNTRTSEHWQNIESAEEHAVERFQDELDAATRANAWIDEIAFTLAEAVKPNAEITQEPAKAVVIWKDRAIYAAAFLVRDQMNFTQMIRLSPPQSKGHSHG
jgi:hypothetical protein